jgi:hypothetical protein
LEQINGLENRKETQIERNRQRVVIKAEEEEEQAIYGMAGRMQKRKEMCGVFCINLELSKSYKRSVKTENPKNQSARCC